MILTQYKEAILTKGRRTCTLLRVHFEYITLVIASRILLNYTASAHVILLVRSSLQQSAEGLVLCKTNQSATPNFQSKWACCVQRLVLLTHKMSCVGSLITIVKRNRILFLHVYIDFKNVHRVQAPSSYLSIHTKREYY